MINNYLHSRRYFSRHKLKQTDLISGLIGSRNLFSIQTVDYDLTTVTSLDIDDGNTFMLVGLSNGAVELQEIEDPTYGNLEQMGRFNFAQFNVNRVQWSPCSDEKFFSILDNHNLYLVDPIEMRVIDKFEFNLKTNWSEWNPNDHKMIAVCGSESYVRLVDVRSGSSAQTVILTAPSGLVSHRATRCLWSKQDLNCLIVGDNEGFIHVYDTRHSSRPQIIAGEELRGQISGMSFTKDNCSIITSHGTENNLVQWTYKRCTLVPSPHKFKKRKNVQHLEGIPDHIDDPKRHPPPKPNAGTSYGKNSHKAATSTSSNGKKRDSTTQKQKRRPAPLPVDAYLRCQFHVTDRHLYCPVPASKAKSKELYIYDIKSGDRIKTLKSCDILSAGVYSVTSLLPESLVVYVGGRGRLRAWSIDEGHQRRMEEKMRSYHRTTWDSDDEEI